MLHYPWQIGVGEMPEKVDEFAMASGVWTSGPSTRSYERHSTDLVQYRVRISRLFHIPHELLEQFYEQSYVLHGTATGLSWETLYQTPAGVRVDPPASGPTSQAGVAIQLTSLLTSQKRSQHLGIHPHVKDVHSPWWYSTLHPSILDSHPRLWAGR